MSGCSFAVLQKLVVSKHAVEIKINVNQLILNNNSTNALYFYCTHTSALKLLMTPDTDDLHTDPDGNPGFDLDVSK